MVAPWTRDTRGLFLPHRPVFPDFPPTGLRFDIDSYCKDLPSVFHLVVAATGLVGELHWFLDWREDREC